MGGFVLAGWLLSARIDDAVERMEGIGERHGIQLTEIKDALKETTFSVRTNTNSLGDLTSKVGDRWTRTNEIRVWQLVKELNPEFEIPRILPGE